MSTVRNECCVDDNGASSYMNMPPLYSAWNADNRGYDSLVEHPKTQIAGIQFSHDRPYFF